MAIVKKDNIFILETKNTHYVIAADSYGNVRNLHWGKKVRTEDYGIEPNDCGEAKSINLDEMHQEYTYFGGVMYRECCLKAEQPDGCRELDLHFASYTIDGNTLCTVLKDSFYPFELTVKYTVYEDYDIITKSVCVKNNGSDDIVVEKLLSAELCLPGVKPYYVLNTNGAWGAEGYEAKTRLDAGSIVFESRRGISGHTRSPYFVAYNNADEVKGDVYFATLCWSGSFKVELNRDRFGTTRAYLGINDFDFEIGLGAGESFSSPEVIFGCSEGFGNMSRNLNRFAVDHVLPKAFNRAPLPVLYNSWEATEFDVSEEGQGALAQKAAKAGCELFVMDDGWFGARNHDHAGLGDWFVNKEKFPNGLDALINKVNGLGMDFGLWFEPEMVNPDSDLFRAHPDWAYHYDTRTAHEQRHQLVLNMTLPEVQQYIYERLSSLLREHNIKYIKWDMNRPLSETGAENLKTPKMLWYYHVKAVYDIVDRLRKEFPEVQFESCSSGGGRADYGALGHFDMVWTSDNTDAIDRLSIQKTYALTRPVKTMRAWVTDVNWYNRNTPLDFRFNVAMRGSLSLGGNLNNYTDEMLDECRKHVEFYKGIRDLVQFGDLYRLLDFEEDEISADIYVSPDKSRAVLFIASVNTKCMIKPTPLYIDGLDENKTYSFEYDGRTITKSGAYLKNVGINVDAKKQYFNKTVIIKSID
ncbi:MAG: alpha-galactosidase [Clostridia bacterium]|nr:alpha-galactosidase [Clostridia bacterium]